MPTIRFRYSATERATGRTHSGEMAAESAYDVRAGLRRVGLEVDSMARARIRVATLPETLAACSANVRAEVHDLRLR